MMVIRLSISWGIIEPIMAAISTSSSTSLIRMDSPRWNLPSRTAFHFFGRGILPSSRVNAATMESSR